uniref:LOW QUALITY PROTEIN: protocadherin alpha-4-like n=1 Tax=Macaca mulatta TaxID=9544 RepID=UPI000732BCD4|nr:LOW QUALITY PROTEIN: protocadherin alpha-4-like [Macaca mulatta]
MKYCFTNQKRGMITAARLSGQESRSLQHWLLLPEFCEAGKDQLHYTILEEAKTAHGIFVGCMAPDLGLELVELILHLFQLDSKGCRDLLEVNLQNGIFVSSLINLKELCGRISECSIHLEVIVDKLLQVFQVEVKVKNIEDNLPVFSATQKNLSETRTLDSRVSLEDVWDADIEANALMTYILYPNDYFSLEIPTKSR